MRLALLFTLLLLGSAVQAQSAPVPTDRLRFDAPYVTRAFDASTGDISAVNRVLNPGPAPIRARWIREVVEAPTGWHVAISDGERENSYRVDSADFVIPAYGSAPITPHVSAAAGAGDVQVTVEVFAVDDRRNAAMSTFRFEQATRRTAPRSVNLYPNPGDDEFRIDSALPLARVTLTNLLGRVVKTFPGTQDSFDVSDLPNGVYLVGMLGTDGRVVKTLRFSKRTARP